MKGKRLIAAAAILVGVFFCLGSICAAVESKYSWYPPYEGAKPVYRDPKTGRPVYLAAVEKESPSQNRWHASLWAGISDGQMSEVRAEVDQTLSHYRNLYSAAFTVITTQTQSDGSGHCLGVDLGYRLTEHLGVGVRTGYFTTSTIVGAFSGVGGINPSIMEYDVELSSNAWPLLVGGWAQKDIGEKWYGELSLYGGLGFGGADIREAINRVGSGVQSYDVSYRISGSAPFVEVGGRVGYEILKGVFAFGELGYHLFRVSEMKYTTSIDVNGDGVNEASKGAVFETLADEPLVFNLSGAKYAVGIDCRF